MVGVKKKIGCQAVNCTRERKNQYGGGSDKGWLNDHHGDVSGELD